MRMRKVLRVKHRDAWRAWLAAHHESDAEVWLVFTKRHTGKKAVTYEDAVEEALCFGWIDSILQRIDDRCYARKFTPRTNVKKWSQANKKRVAKLIREGRMTAAGLAKVGYAQPERFEGAAAPTSARKRPVVVPAFIERALRENPAAWSNFSALAPSCRRNYVGWIAEAKREETRQRRLREVIGVLAANKKLGLK